MTSVMSLARPALRARRAGLRPLGRAAGAAGIAATLAAVSWLVLAAAERPSVLSPPSVRAEAGWLQGPLQGAMPSLSDAPGPLHTYALVAVIVAGAGWALAWLFADALPMRALFGAVGAVHVVLFLGPPLALTDVFNYELYARMAALRGLNPYVAQPIDAAADPSFLLANWHHLSSPYGPLFTLASEALVPLGVHGWFWAYKAVVVLASLATVWLTGALAQRLGVSRRRAVAALGLSPLLLVYEVGGFHNDVPAVLCLVAAAWCVVRARDGDAPGWMDAGAGALAVAAAGIKPSFAIVVAIVVLGAANRLRALAGAAAAAAAAGLVMLIAYGGALPDLGSQGQLVTPLSVPNLLGLAAGHGGADEAVRTVAQVLLALTAVAATVAVALRRAWAVSAIGLVMFGALVCLPWVMPWYLLWALPFIAVGRSRALAAAMVVATCWLVIGGLSTLPGILHTFGYYPTRLPTGQQNHLEFVRLVR